MSGEKRLTEEYVVHDYDNEGSASSSVRSESATPAIEEDGSSDIVGRVAELLRSKAWVVVAAVATLGLSAVVVWQRSGRSTRH